MSFTHTFTSAVNITIYLPPMLGGQPLNLSFKGSRTFQFEPHEKGDKADGKADLYLVDYDLLSDGASVSVNLPGVPAQNVDISPTQISQATLPVDTVQGLADLNSRRFSIQYKLDASTGVVGALAEIGIYETVPIVIMESGTFNFDTSVIQSRVAIKVDPNYEGIFRTVARANANAARGCGGSEGGAAECESYIYLNASIIIDDDTPPGSTHTVYTCPGDPVQLDWKASPDITKVSITDNHGNTYNTDILGPIKVAPDTSTIYTITATGDCDDTAIAEVIVATNPITYRLSVGMSSEWEWTFTASRYHFSESLRVTGIQPTQFSEGAFEHHPRIIDLTYAACMGFNKSWGNVRWMVQHRPSAGGITLFQVNEGNMTCNSLVGSNAQRPPGGSLPMIASWQFWPLEMESSKPPEGSADFLFELACK